MADDLVLVPVAQGHLRLAGQLDRGLDGLGSAGNEVGMVQIPRRDLGEQPAKLGSPRIRDGRVRVGVVLELGRDRPLDSRVVVRQVDRHRPTRGIEVPVAVRVVDEDAFGALDLDVHRVVGERMAPVAFGAERVGQRVRGGRGCGRGSH